MTDDVKPARVGPDLAEASASDAGSADASARPSLRQAQIEHTEERIVAAAAELFLAQGYVDTTLAAVAARAGVGARTVYVRFGTKAALFKRVIDVAIVGDTAPVDVVGRDWMQLALTAPTAAERISAGVAAGRQIMQRTGPLFAIAQQAAAVEPAVAESWQQGREQTYYVHRLFWTRMAEDALLDPAVDLQWLIDTTAILGSAETYLLITRMNGWDPDTYEAWAIRTWTQLATPPAPRSATGRGQRPGPA
ncbi:MAG TPA: TetR/AcrR family transcriptional regulator [Streptosporangiaceae bacterium]|jgi:AcrR family transcriptional regulator